MTLFNDEQMNLSIRLESCWQILCRKVLLAQCSAYILEKNFAVAPYLNAAGSSDDGWFPVAAAASVLDSLTRCFRRRPTKDLAVLWLL